MINYRLAVKYGRWAILPDVTALRGQPIKMKTEIVPLDYTVKLIGGLKTRLVNGEVRNESFSGTPHLSVMYIAPSGDIFYGWLPLTYWAGGQILSTCRTALADVWN